MDKVNLAKYIFLDRRMIHSHKTKTYVHKNAFSEFLFSDYLKINEEGQQNDINNVFSEYYKLHSSFMIKRLLGLHFNFNICKHSLLERLKNKNLQTDHDGCDDDKPSNERRLRPEEACTDGAVKVDEENDFHLKTYDSNDIDIKLSPRKELVFMNAKAGDQVSIVECNDELYPTSVRNFDSARPFVNKN